jgi:hypothetical protein
MVSIGEVLSDLPNARLNVLLSEADLDAARTSARLFVSSPLTVGCLFRFALSLTLLSLFLFDVGDCRREACPEIICIAHCDSFT